MDNENPPSKPVLIAAILPLVVALAGMLVFLYFGKPLGAVISIISLISYYVIFGIVYAVISLKHDEQQKEIDKAASIPLKIGTVFLVVFSVLTVAGAFISFGFGKIPITVACMVAFVLGVILFAVVIALSSRVRKAPPKSANRRGEGVCTACVPCIGVSYFKGFAKVNGKIVTRYGDKSTYKIIVEIDERRLTAYSHSVYGIGDTVQIAYSDRSKKGYIIQNSDD